MKLTDDQIKRINKQCPYGQGVFLQPFGIPDSVKELVVYGSYESGGVSGGNCWNDAKPEPYFNEPPRDRMMVLDLIMEELCPNITLLQYRKIEKMINTLSNSRREYYGNYTNNEIEYLELSKIYKVLDK